MEPLLGKMAGKAEHVTGRKVYAHPRWDQVMTSTAPYDAFSENYDAVNYDAVNSENYDGVNLRHHTRKKFRCGLSWWLLTLKHT